MTILQGDSNKLLISCYFVLLNQVHQAEVSERQRFFTQPGVTLISSSPLRGFRADLAITTPSDWSYVITHHQHYAVILEVLHANNTAAGWTRLRRAVWAALTIIAYSCRLSLEEVAVIRMRHITMNGASVIIELASGKTLLHRAEDQLCPVKALESWLAESQYTSGHSFRTISATGQIGYGRMLSLPETQTLDAGDMQISVSRVRKHELWHLGPNFWGFLVEIKRIKAGETIFVEHPPADTPVLIAAWIMNSCDELKINGRSGLPKERRLSFPNAQSMRAALKRRKIRAGEVATIMCDITPAILESTSPRCPYCGRGCHSKRLGRLHFTFDIEQLEVNVPLDGGAVAVTPARRRRTLFGALKTNVDHAQQNKTWICCVLLPMLLEPRVSYSSDPSNGLQKYADLPAVPLCGPHRLGKIGSAYPYALQSPGPRVIKQILRQAHWHVRSNIPFVGKLVIFPALIAVSSFLFVPVQPLHRDKEAFNDDWNEFNDLRYSANKFRPSTPHPTRALGRTFVRFPVRRSFLFVPVPPLHRDNGGLPKPLRNERRKLQTAPALKRVRGISFFKRRLRVLQTPPSARPQSHLRRGFRGAHLLHCPATADKRASIESRCMMGSKTRGTTFPLAGTHSTHASECLKKCTSWRSRRPILPDAKPGLLSSTPIKVTSSAELDISSFAFASVVKIEHCLSSFNFSDLEGIECQNRKPVVESVVKWPARKDRNACPLSSAYAGYSVCALEQLRARSRSSASPLPVTFNGIIIQPDTHAKLPSTTSCYPGTIELAQIRATEAMLVLSRIHPLPSGSLTRTSDSSSCRWKVQRLASKIITGALRTTATDLLDFHFNLLPFTTGGPPPQPGHLQRRRPHPYPPHLAPTPPYLNRGDRSTLRNCMTTRIAHNKEQAKAEMKQGRSVHILGRVQVRGWNRRGGGSLGSKGAADEASGRAGEHGVRVRGRWSNPHAGHHQGHTVDIFTDCQPAISAISSPRAAQAVPPIHRRLLRARPSLKICIHSVPVYVRIDGNAYRHTVRHKYMLYSTEGSQS
ncbi:hypothetical protein C8R46DRAFT_1030562 [Mycena filopes]|nr:hypothetical protein C8R46DRAFT_1030562 [Mycena filopes]